MSTTGEIWEVMAEEISGHPRDRFEMYRGKELELEGAHIAFGSTGVKDVVAASERDVVRPPMDGEATLAAACKLYDVPIEDVRNNQMRRTAVIAVRASVSTTLDASGWRSDSIAQLLNISPSSVSHILRGGRGKGVFASSKIVRKLVSTDRTPHHPAPQTLAEAWAAEARGEGVVRFVDGIPQWIPNETPRDLNEHRAAI